MKQRKLGYIGDVNYIEYGGGPVFSDNGYGEQTVEYTHGLETEAPDWDEFDDPEWEDGGPGPNLEVYSVSFPKTAEEFRREYDWVDWDSVAEASGYEVEDILSDDALSSAVGRAQVVNEAALYYGWYEFDQYPTTMSLRELLRRWNEEW